MRKRLKILDWFTHQGHQKELFKLDHDFFLVGVNNTFPNWNKKHRSLSKNVTLTREDRIGNIKFDIVIIRSPVHSRSYTPHIRAGAIPIAVVQTTNYFMLPRECQHVVWNSADVMNKFKHNYPGKHHKYIVHGYDPDEFTQSDCKKNGRILTVANVFKGRSKIMGYPLWNSIRREINKLDAVGHGNEDIYGVNKQAKTFEELIKIYNSYSIYFNPTIESAMPRSRAEAAMCGCPIVTTDNFDIGRYFVNGKNAVLTNDRSEIIDEMKKLLSSEQMRKDYGNAAREVAIKHFHIDDFLKKWESILDRI
jgi:glycosyltransferase involved in cell wall biosynthesis